MPGRHAHAWPPFIIPPQVWRGQIHRSQTMRVRLTLDHPRGHVTQAVQALLALQPAPDLSARDLCPPGHAWLPRHTINTTYTPSAAAAAAQASAHLGSSPAGARARPALSPSPPLGPDARVQPAPASHAPLHGHTPSLPQASWLAGSSPSPRARRATVIPHPPVSSPSSPISRTVAAKAAACAKAREGGREGHCTA